MAQSKRADVAADAVLNIRAIRERVVATGADDPLSFASLLNTLGATEAALLRWYAEAVEAEHNERASA